ncbi:hypothetical protein CICLE_v10023866mg [Citrus x clementina]|uniref:ADP-ribosyl cyclase/cyclic ADP-ribose hydrolase n=1 Tax=Citrus clementina TaxID=85681 RepID=V4TYI4_CITCL|nr:hypothetical protein CICLE_v10023866mg [Citrus x clementina]
MQELITRVFDGMIQVLKIVACLTWCLGELVPIVECKNRSNPQQMMFPIFCEVEPTVKRKQARSFRDTFSKDEEAFSMNIENVQKWRDAFRRWLMSLTGKDRF